MCPTASGLVGDGLCCGKLASASPHTGIQVLTEDTLSSASSVVADASRGTWLSSHPSFSPSLLPSSLSSYFHSTPPPASFSSFIPSFFPPFFFPQTFNEPLLCSTSGKEPTCQCRRHERLRFNLWVGKIPLSRKCNPLQYSCLFNPMDRGTWQVSVHMVAKQSDLTEVTEP